MLHKGERNTYVSQSSRRPSSVKLVFPRSCASRWSLKPRSLGYHPSRPLPFVSSFPFSFFFVLFFSRSSAMAPSSKFRHRFQNSLDMVAARSVYVDLTQPSGTDNAWSMMDSPTLGRMWSASMLPDSPFERSTLPIPALVRNSFRVISYLMRSDPYHSL